MAWFILARLLFVGAVAYSAFLLRPLGADPLANVLVRPRPRAAVGGLRMAAAQYRASRSMLGALLGGAVGLLLAKGISAALFWVDHGDQRVAFLHSFILLVFPYLGLVIGGRKGEWLEPARLIEPVPRRRARSATTRSSTPR